MTAYLELLKRDNIESNLLVVLRPRAWFYGSSGWSTYATNHFYRSFDLGYPSSVTVDGAAVAEDTVCPPTSGKWAFDVSNKRIYLNLGSAITTKSVVITYELYFGTKDLNAGRDPLDQYSFNVYYVGAVTDVPKMREGSPDLAFGYFPIQATSISLANYDYFGEKHAYSSSFNRAEIDVYHLLGDEWLAESCRLILSGLTKDISMNAETVTLNVIDRNEILESEIRSDHDNPDTFSKNYFTTAAFPALDPSAENKPIRRNYGKCHLIIPVNVDYNALSPIGKNRKWVCGRGTSSSITLTALSGCTSTTLKLSTSDCAKLEVGDTLKQNWGLNQIPDPTVRISAIDYGTGVCTINSWGLPGTPSAGNTVTRYNAARVEWTGPDGRVCVIRPGSGYTVFDDATNGVWGIQLTADAEKDYYYAVYNGGMRQWIEPSDVIAVTLYGDNAGGFSEVTAAANGCVNNAVAILYMILRRLGIASTDIDVTGFQALMASNTTKIGLSIPGDEPSFPKAREVVEQILQSILARIYVDPDGLWTVRQIGPLGASADVLTDAEIIDGSIGHEFDYSEIASTIRVGYEKRETNNGQREVAYKESTKTNNMAKWLHGVTKESTFNTLISYVTDAAILSQRLAYWLGDRRARTTVSTKNERLLREQGDAVTVRREKLPGYVFQSGAIVSRDFALAGITKGIKQVDMELEDQKGIQDNSGSW